MNPVSYMRRVECFGGPFDGRSVEVLSPVGLIVPLVEPPGPNAEDDECPPVPAQVVKRAPRYEIVAADIAVYVGGGQ